MNLSHHFLKLFFCRQVDYSDSGEVNINSGLFSGDNIIFDLSNEAIASIIEGLYYPQSPYLFNIIEPNLLGKIYEVFLTEQLVFQPDGKIGLGKKRDFANRSVVTTPTEIVRYMVDKTLTKACERKTPEEILRLHIAEICTTSLIRVAAA